MVDVSGGWIKLYRSVRHNWLWQNGNERYAKWWMDILMMVNHEPRKVFVNGRLMTIGVGQRLTSLKKLGEMWGVDWRTVSKFLDLLAEDNMIELAKSKTEGTTLKVLNYADYQTFSEEKRKRSVPQDVPGYVPDNVVPPVPDNVDKQEPKNSKEPKNEKNISSSSSGDVSPFDFWEKNGFGFLSPKTRTDLKYWNQDFQEVGATPIDADRLLVKAMGVAIDAGALNYKYVNGILHNWESKKFKSPEEVDTYELSRQAKTGDVSRTNSRRSKSSGGRGPTKPYGGIRL